MIPKKSLTGDNSERVDTRVLQVIYALPDEPPVEVYVGQQMDVFLAVDQPDSYLVQANPAVDPTDAGGSNSPRAKCKDPPCRDE